MDSNLYDKIEILIKTLDLRKINLELVRTNSKKLVKIWKELETIWNEINMNQIQYDVYDDNNSKYNEIINLSQDTYLLSNSNITNIITESKYIHCLSYSNIYFFWLSKFENKDLKNQDYLLSLNMFKISLCLNRYKFNLIDQIPRYIIWIPINKKRDFKYNKISKTNLKKTQKDFEAFVASGVTFGSNPKITIITRYEEVEKLLIHELIHNYNIDGSGFHNKLNNILNKYKLVKNKTNSKNKNYHYEYSIYESYTELLSTYFYLLFKNLSDNISSSEIKTKLLGQIIVELLYSYNLICNLASLNGYKSYNKFKDNLVFEGNICGYEYYFIKGLMYNNYEIYIGNSINDFKNIYRQIIVMIEKIKLSDDILLCELYEKQKKQKNFKYQIH